ncbi:hypothetical protein GOC53_28125 [Sinorhizobium medicae]|nr:hypothetical protein [Sinorhizobium medicae]MDX0532995.1 hypothetical protein [Sinorhizobium medicae]MDX0998839.1 hypothetical protein [Sinorhizobium medicae]MDX1182784.1 hypothetical protein [Sinorhizobium medicae]
MVVSKTVFRLLSIAVLCLMVANVHGGQAAGYLGTHRDCPSVTEPNKGSATLPHLGSCCGKMHCCPILADPPCEASNPIASGPTLALRNESLPFLLVRAIHPPPKHQLS